MIRYTTETFIQKAKEIHNNKYTYDKLVFQSVHKKVIITCPIHGDFEQLAAGHLAGKGCIKCRQDNLKKQLKMPLETFIEKAKACHTINYNYSKVKFSSVRDPIEIICPIHGIFLQRASRHLEGCDCPKCAHKNQALKIRSTKKEFIKKANKIHHNKYDYSKVIYNGVYNKVSIICPIHGEFELTPQTHLQGHGCPVCSKIIKFNKQSLTEKEFKEKANKIHNNFYDYSKVIYKGYNNKIIIGCPTHGFFKQTGANHLAGRGCPICKASHGEKAIQKFLIEHNIKYIAQKRFLECKDKGTLPFDFYLPDFNTCIEYQGRQHFIPVDYFGGEIALREQQKRDKIKKDFCKKFKIRLIEIKFTDNLNSKLKILAE